MKLLFADKPAGATTHTSLNERDRRFCLKDRNDGLVEMLRARSPEGGALHVVHRLDRDTTGAIAFARTPEDAERLRGLFESRSVSKTYLLLTDRSIRAKELEVESRIERQGNEFVSSKPSPDSPANAKTRFRLLEESHGVALWEAKPESGKPHQIRLHAADSGFPILGDATHGGSAFPALCLHSASLSFEVDGEVISHSSPEPRWFKNRELVRNLDLVRWLSAVDRRERLLRSWAACGSIVDDSASRTLRWIHTEGDPLRAEQLGLVHSLSWFSEVAPRAGERQSIERLARELGWEKWYVQVRSDRGRAPNEAEILRSSSEIPERWNARENGLEYEFRLDTGLSPGLFLDQRRNRAWVREHSKDARVLNLFCYTGGFSVAAAAGGASKTVSVDVSKPFLEWSKRNFDLNGLSLEGHEFRAMDSREYLAWAKKKGLEFDVVICDPPSFSRSKSGLFKIQDELDDLLSSLCAVVGKGGRLLFATNYEGWTEEKLEGRVRASMNERATGFDIESTPSPDWDFETPGRTRNMKSFFLVRAR